jgi:DNA-directed RNA polymerase specialized sigma subunit
MTKSIKVKWYPSVDEGTTKFDEEDLEMTFEEFNKLPRDKQASILQQLVSELPERCNMIIDTWYESEL